MVELIPQTDGAKSAIHGNDKLVISFFPFRLGRNPVMPKARFHRKFLSGA